MRFRFLKFVLLALAFSPPIFAQSTAKTFTFTANGQTHCIGTTALPTMGIQATGTFTLTLTPQVSINGQTPQSTQVTPSNSSTAQSTITAAGAYVSAVGGYDTFCLSTTAYTSGTATVQLNPSPALNASLLGGGGGLAVGGDLAPLSASAQEVIGIQDNLLPALSAGFLNWNGTDWLYTPGSFSAGIYAWDYGVYGEGHTSSNIVVASQPTKIVTCSDCNFTTQAFVGQVFWASDLPSLGGVTAPVLITAPNTTIASIDSNTQIHVSQNITSNCTAQQCTAYWVTDETTALSNAYTAALDGCTGLILPGVSPEGGPAIIGVSSGEFQGATTSCGETGVGASRTGVGVYGAGSQATYIAVTPAMSASSCTSGAATNACFGGNLDGAQYCCFSITGGGNGQPGSAFNSKIGFELDGANNAQMWNLQFLFWGSGATTGALGIGVELAGGDIFTNALDIDGFGFVAEKVVPYASVGPVYQSNSEVYDTPSGVWADNSSTVDLFTTNNNYASGNNLGAGACINNGGRWRSNGDSFGLASGNFGAAQLYVGYCIDISGAHTGAGTVFLSGSSVYSSGSSNTIYLNGSSDILHLQGSNIVGAGGTTVLNNNGGFIYDDCGNTFSANGGTLVSNSGTIFGSCSITGTLQTSSNISGGLTNFGTSPSVAMTSGVTNTSRSQSFTITIGSAPTGTATMAITQPTPFLAAPICNALIVGGNNTTLGYFTPGTPSATVANFTYVGTLVGADTLVVQVNCQ